MHQNFIQFHSVTLKIISQQSIRFLRASFGHLAFLGNFTISQSNFTIKSFILKFSNSLNQQNGHRFRMFWLVVSPHWDFRQIGMSQWIGCVKTWPLVVMSTLWMKASELHQNHQLSSTSLHSTLNINYYFTISQQSIYFLLGFTWNTETALGNSTISQHKF